MYLIQAFKWMCFDVINSMLYLLHSFTCIYTVRYQTKILLQHSIVFLIKIQMITRRTFPIRTL